MLMFFFVNKPLTLFLYLLGLCLMIMLSFADSRYYMTVIPLIVSFTLFYSVCLMYYFFLRGDPSFEIRGIPIKTLKRPMQIYFVLYILACLLTFYFYMSQRERILFFPAAFLVFYSFISFVILQSALITKFISAGLKQNKKLRDFNLEHLYEEMREILLKRLID